MIDWTKPIQTACGKPAKVISKESSPRYPWRVKIDSKNYSITFTNAGYQFDDQRAGFRIINTPEQTMLEPKPKLDWTAPLRRIGG